MLAVCSEVTPQVVGERRLGLLRDLAAKAGETRQRRETCADMAGRARRRPARRALPAPASCESRMAACERGRGDRHRRRPSRGLAGGAALALARALAGEARLGRGPGRRLLPAASGRIRSTARSSMPLAGEAGQPPLGVLVARRQPEPRARRGLPRLPQTRRRPDLDAPSATPAPTRRSGAAPRRWPSSTAPRRSFFSNVSHEFRTPLTLMLGPLEEVLASDRLGERGRVPSWTWPTATRCACCRLVNTLLDFSRVEAGRAQATFAPVDLAALTADLASTFRSAVERGGLSLAGRLPAAARARLRRPGHVGEDRPQPALERLQVHLPGRHRRPAGADAGTLSG